MNQHIENNQVQNIVQFKQVYKDQVQKLVHIRNEAGVTQEFMADWFGVDRRKIIAFEKLKKINLELLLLYADKFDTEIKLNCINH